MNKQSELTIFTKAKDLCTYIMTITQKSPKHFRYTFISRLQNLSLDIIEKLYRANDTFVTRGNQRQIEKRLEFQQEAMTSLKLLCYFSQLAMEQGCILYLREELNLEFNEKTQIFPIKNGMDYLGFHFYLTENGKVVRKIRNRTKQKYKKKLKHYQYAYTMGECTLEDISQTIHAYQAHLSHGNTWHLRHKVLSDFVLTKKQNIVKSGVNI